MASDVVVISRKLVEAHPFLGVDPRHVQSWLVQCAERTFRPEQQLCKEKTYGEEAYVIAEGRVIVSRLDRKGFPQRLSVLDAPVLVGQLSLIDNAMRSATLTAEGVVVARVIDLALWRRIAGSPTPEGSAMRRVVMSSLQQQLYRTHQQISEIAAGVGAAPAAVQPERVIPVVRLDEDDFAPDHLTDDLTDEQKIAAINPYKR